MNCERSLQIHNRENAFILIVVLWVSFGLVSIALLFGHSMMMEYRAAENTAAAAQAQQTVEGAARYAMYVLANVEEAGDVPDPEEYANERAEIGESAFWFIGRDYSNLSSETLAFGLIDECSKLNINTATVEMLEALPYMTSELAAAIIDWRDEDDEITENGAESRVYQMRIPSFECKNAPFETVDEIHMLYGADWNVLYGEDVNRNGLLDPNENDGNTSYPEDNQNGSLDPGILEYLTVYSREPNSGSDSDTKINVAGDSDTELTELLQETFDDDRATEILAGVGAQTGEVDSLLAFYLRSGMTAEEFDEIDDSLTVSDEDSQEGLININTASEAVLACIPGIGTDNVSAVVSYRQSNANNLTSVAWLAEVLEEDDAITAGPYVTTKSYQFTADIAAVGPNGNGFCRVQFVIDTSEGDPVIRYRKDLTRYGWALGREIRRELAYLKEQMQ